MPSYYDDIWGEQTGFVDGYDDTDDDYDENDCVNDGYSDVEEDEADYAAMAADNRTARPPVWKNVRIQGEHYMVSDHGCIKKPDTLFEVHYGLEQQGSPYKTVTFPTGVTYFMHDLVWQAFNGVPPPGWEVCHTAAEASRRHRHYSNALRHLTIMPARALSRPPRIFSAI